MSYVLKENNAFYGSKGNRISNQLYNRLPTHHQLLFEKYDSNNNSSYDELMNEIKIASHKFRGAMPKHVKINVNEGIDLGNVFHEGLVMNNQPDEFIGALEEDDDNEYDHF